MGLEEEDIIRDFIEKNRPDTSRHRSYGDGWYNNMPLMPDLGTVSTQVQDGPIVRFTDGGYAEHEGIVDSIIYVRGTGRYSVGIVSYEYQIMGDDKDFKRHIVPYDENRMHVKFVRFNHKL